VPTAPAPLRRRLRTFVRLGLVTALAGAVGALGLPSASAAGDGRLRLAHLSPDTPAVDVYVASVSDPSADVRLPGVGYGTVSDYRTVPTGVYTVSMRKAGADPATPPVLSTTVEVGDGVAQTVAGVGHFADLGLRVLQDDLTTPPAGQARVRVVAAAAQAGTVDVSVAGGPTVATGLPFAATSGYVDVPAGRTSLQVAPAGAAATSLPVTVAPGAVYSVLVLDRPGGGLTVRPVLDAAGPAMVPSGSVAAGEGGTAGTTPGGSPGGTVVGTVVLAAGGVAGLAAAGLLVTFLPGVGRRPGSRPDRGA
jgi:Domain of unknown function (DUF4397)